MDSNDIVTDADETSNLLNTIPPGISSRTHSINGTQSGIFELPEVYKSRWRSIRVMYLTMFLSSVSFSICMSSLYPFLKILDPSANTNFLGWVVAAYSVGQFIASPFFGAWSNFRARTREPIVVSLIINILANVLYMYLESIDSYGRVLIVLARGFVGFGAGNVAVVRSYVSGATTLSERTPAMANMSAFQAIGFIIGPLIQTALVPVGYPGVVHTTALHLNMYTATAMFSALVGVVNVVLLLVVFKEHTVMVDQFTPRQIQYSEDSESYDDECNADEHPNYYSVALAVFLFFSILFIFAVFETIATPLSMHMFAWKKAEATLYIGIMLGAAGVVSIAVFTVIKILSKRFNERYLLLGGFIICLFGFIVYLPWGHQYPAIQYATMQSSENITSVSMPSQKYSEINMLVGHSPLDDNTTTNNTSNAEAVGCPYYYTWCFNTPAVRLWQFFLGTFFIAIGYPTCNVMSYAIYSKILGPKPQGIWMGLLTAAGSLARTLGPVFVSQVYDAYGPRVTFLSLVGMIIFTLFWLVVKFKKLVPYTFTQTMTVN